MSAPLTYVLRFHRPPYAQGTAEPPTTGPGLTVRTRVLDGSLAAQLDELGGAEATLELTFAVNQDSTLFFEWGSVRFGAAGAASLSFSSIGTGTLLPDADADGFRHGTVSYLVTGGTGALAGASGIINSNFLLNLDPDSNELVDTHLGVIHLP